MKRIALAPQDESEVAVLQLTNAEHAVLHQHARDFVNINNIFGRPVSNVKLESHAQPDINLAASTTWTTTIRHWPTCNCSGTCLNGVEPTA